MNKVKRSKQLEKLCINTIRLLGINAIRQANSGHPGIVLGAAPIMYELFFNHLNVSPKYLNYYNRDRFVLSAGHGSALLYATMLTAGYKSITMDDLKQFRQINSKTPGHPENTMLEGIEVCTGPLGQGIAMAVGMAIAEAKLSASYNIQNKIINHYTYCLFGDGCFQEGVSYEAISLAGKLKLNKLIMFYDSNNIQLDGKVYNSTITNTRKYFKSLNWNYIKINNGNNHNSISRAIKRAKFSLKPTVIECKTTIGYGSENSNTNFVHGTPLNDAQITDLKKFLKYDFDDFFIPNEIEELSNKLNIRVDKNINIFNKKLREIEKTNINLYNKIISLINKENDFKFSLSWFDPQKFSQKSATRDICGEILNILAFKNENLMISNADISSSTKVRYLKSLSFNSEQYNQQNIEMGVREFAMASINNGITVHGGCKAVGSTFLSFSDYNKPAIRLAAIGKIPVINVYSHDTILVGEDGPTHQPIEQLSTLRLIPNHFVFRPTCYMDMIVAWEFALLNNNSPTTIIASKTAFEQINVDYEKAKYGAYELLTQTNVQYELTLYATGSEIELANNVSKILLEQNIYSRVIAINSLELLLKQESNYINKIFDYKPKVSIEFGSTSPWYKYVDLAIGLDEFGISAKVNDIISKFNLQSENIANNIIKWYKINYNK